jgi:hypothetical protein
MRLTIISTYIFILGFGGGKNYGCGGNTQHKECARTNIFFGVEFCILEKSENGVQQARRVFLTFCTKKKSKGKGDVLHI